jgi:Holin of 3TMs, for gene-transfer release
MTFTGLGELAQLGQTIAKAILPDKAQEAQDAAAFKIAQLVADTDVFKAQAAIVAAEAGGTGIKAWWRPVTMLTFVAIVVARFLGFDAHAMTPADYEKLWTLIQIGLGGYVGGRSVEKVAAVIAPVLAKGGGR